MWKFDDTNITNFGEGIVDMETVNDTSDDALGTADPGGVPVALSSTGETTKMTGSLAWNIQAILNEVWIPDVTATGAKTYTITNLTEWREMVADLKAHSNELWAKNVLVNVDASLTLNTESTDKIQISNVIGSQGRPGYTDHGGLAFTTSLASSTIVIDAPFSILEANSVNLGSLIFTAASTSTLEFKRTGANTGSTMKFDRCRAGLEFDDKFAATNLDVVSAGSEVLDFSRCSRFEVLGSALKGGYTAIEIGQNSFGRVINVDGGIIARTYGISCIDGSRYEDDGNTIYGGTKDRYTTTGGARMYDTTGAGVWGVSYND